MKLEANDVRKHMYPSLLQGECRYVVSSDGLFNFYRHRYFNVGIISGKGYVPEVGSGWVKLEDDRL